MNNCQSEKPISFGQFKNIPDPVDLQNLAIQLDPLEHRSDTADTDRARSLRSRFARSQPRKLFERNRNERLSRHYDNIDGPFYIDPNLMDKFRSPKKCKYSGCSGSDVIDVHSTYHNFSQIASEILHKSDKRKALDSRSTASERSQI